MLLAVGMERADGDAGGFDRMVMLDGSGQPLNACFGELSRAAMSRGRHMTNDRFLTTK